MRSKRGKTVINPKNTALRIGVGSMASRRRKSMNVMHAHIIQGTDWPKDTEGNEIRP